LTESFRAAVLNVRPVYVIVVKENVVQLAHHFAASLALIEVAFFLKYVRNFAKQNRGFGV
jgi:hypothetical protein